MMDMNVIPIPHPSDKLFGFLSNDSKHGFTERTEDGTYIFWQTVTHYIEAKKFEGTQYENEIRIAPTVMQVKRMTRRREISIKGDLDEANEKTYGTAKGNGFQIKQSWEGDLEKLLRIAIHAKFSQNSFLIERLVTSSPKMIEGGPDKINSITAHIIMELRHKYVKLSPKTNSIIKPTLSDNRLCIIREICMKISKHIADMERWDRILPEMVEDSIFNICRNKKLFTRIQSSQQQIDKEYFLNTRKLFVQIDPFQSDIDAPTDKVVKFVMWCCMSEKKTQLMYGKISRFIEQLSETGTGHTLTLKNFDTLIVIPHSKRWYRDKSNNKIITEQKKMLVEKTTV